jgi:hypothetical protein
MTFGKGKILNYEKLTWIISVISATDCCLFRSSVVKASPTPLVVVSTPLVVVSSIRTFKAVAISNKTYTELKSYIMYLKREKNTTLVDNSLKKKKRV